VPSVSAAIFAWPRNPSDEADEVAAAVPLTVRSMVSTGMCFALAAANAGARPSEFSGATMSTWAPWAIMSG